MPEPNLEDNVLDNVVEVELESPDNGENSNDGETEMADVPALIHEQNLTRLSQAGIGAHEHHISFAKILDLNYEQDRKVVSLVQALGVREVVSQSGQTGVPLAGGVSGK